MVGNKAMVGNRKITEWAVIVGAFLLFPMMASAEDHCPWLNNATASGILNSPAVVKVHRTAADGVACLFFSHVPASPTFSIVITGSGAMNRESSLELGRCTSPLVHLKGIGNDAEACSIENGHAAEEIVVGRVRDKRFVVSINVSADGDQPFDKKVFLQKAESVAEQVAGALF